MDIRALWSELNDVHGVLAGALGLLTAIITLLTAVVSRTVAVRATPVGEFRETPRVPIRISLKSLLKGWFSTLFWSVLCLGIAGVALGFLAAKRVEDRAGSQRQAISEEHWRAEFNNLLTVERVQVVLLLVAGCVYVRGAYVAARSAKTTSLMKLTHGLVAVASFELAATLFLHHYFPELLEASKPPLIQQWEYVAMAAGCVIGAIMGSED
jgi:hypothetical protein